MYFFGMSSQWIYYKYYVDDGYVRAQTRVNLIFCVCFSLPLWPTVQRQYGNTGYRVFKRGYKLERIFHKNHHPQKKLMNFENWCNGELSKIEHHLCKSNLGTF